MVLGLGLCDYLTATSTGLTALQLGDNTCIRHGREATRITVEVMRIVVTCLGPFMILGNGMTSAVMCHLGLEVTHLSFFGKGPCRKTASSLLNVTPLTWLVVRLY